MEPNAQNDEAPQSNDIVSSDKFVKAPLEAPKDKSIDEALKSSKAKIWCLAIVAVIAVTAAIVFAYLYFANAGNSGQPQPQPQSQSQSTSTPTTTDPNTQGEVKITDTYILRDLDEKISILHLDTTLKPTIIKYRGTHPELPLYKEGNLSKSAKLARVAEYLSNRNRDLTSVEIESIIEDLELTGQEAEGMRSHSYRGIDGYLMAQKYLDLYGENLTPDQTILNDYCPYYIHNASYDFYYLSPFSGCGGTGSYTNQYYKNSYTTDGDHAYVYVSATTLDAADLNIYCDVLQYDQEEKPEVCGTFSDESEFTLNESNYQDFAQYRFVFSKASDGTYYFEKVEKVQN